MKIAKRYLLFIVSILVLFVTACDLTSGDPDQNREITVEITSFGGVDTAEDALNDTLAFQQRIHWTGYDSKGRVEGFAFRVGLEMNDGSVRFVRTAGYDNVSSPVTTSEEQAYNQEIEFSAAEVNQSEDYFKYGWVNHHKDGVNSAIPLQLLDANDKTIWTKNRYAIINFPSAMLKDTTATGEDSLYVIPDMANVKSHFFEIKAVNDLEQESSIVRQYFTVIAEKQVISVQTTKGNFESSDEGQLRRIGQGITLQFGLLQNFEYFGAVPWYYKFKLKEVDVNTGEELNSTEWIDTRFLNDDGDVRFVTVYTDQIVGVEDERKLLPLNLTDDGAPSTKTVIEAFGVDITGVKSETVSHEFIVSSLFKPQAMIYLSHTYGVGEYHFSPIVPNSDGDLPVITAANGYNSLYGLQLYKNTNNEFATIFDPRFKIQARWGYDGEYTANNPNDKRQGAVFDAETGVNYLSEVRFYDLRLNGDFYYYYPLVNDPVANHIVTEIDENGNEERWLRVPSNYTIAQKTLFSNDLLKSIPSDVTITDENREEYVNRFEVRVVDLQGVTSEPDVLDFYLYERKEIAERNGALIVTRSADTNVNQANAYYAELAPELQEVIGDDVHFINLEEPQYDFLNSDQLNPTKEKLSPADLNNYKFVIFANEQPTGNASSFLYNDYKSIVNYLKTNGNALFTSNKKFRDSYSALNERAIPIFQYLGIANRNLTNVKILGPSYNTNDYLKSVVNQEVNELSLDVEMEPGLNHFSGLIQGEEDSSFLANGLAEVSYFLDDMLYYDTAETMFTITPTDDYVEDEVGLGLANKVIGVKNTLGEQKVYTFTFPLSAMKKEQVKDLLENIWNAL